MMNIKNLPIVTVLYEKQDISKISQKQVLDMIVRKGKYVYVLPCVSDCIDAQKMICSFERIFVDNLYVHCAYDQLYGNYREVEVAHDKFSSRSHVIVITTQYCITGCVLDKFMGWEVVFHDVPELQNTESVSVGQISKRLLSDMFQLEEERGGYFKIKARNRVCRRTVVEDDLASVFARLHKFSKFGKALCRSSWKYGDVFDWSSKWDIRELKAFSAITIYAENNPNAAKKLVEILGSS
jgi:hypothetical protein